MKVVILAAGKGERILPLTENIPKVLVDINGKPFLFFLMKSLQKAGYTEFGLVVGYKKEKIVDFLDAYDFEATLIHQGEQLGTGHAVLQAKDFVGGDNFVCTNGDDLRGVEDFEAMRKEDEFNYVMGAEVDNPEKFGVLVVKNGFLEKVVEKPKEFMGKLVNTGIYKFTPEIFAALEKIEKSERGEYEVTDAISLLAQEKKVKVITQKGFWMGIGRKEDIPHVEEKVKELGF